MVGDGTGDDTASPRLDHSGGLSAPAPDGRGRLSPTLGPVRFVRHPSDDRSRPAAGRAVRTMRVHMLRALRTTSRAIRHRTSPGPHRRDVRGADPRHPGRGTAPAGAGTVTSSTKQYPQVSSGSAEATSGWFSMWA